MAPFLVYACFRKFSPNLSRSAVNANVVVGALLRDGRNGDTEDNLFLLSHEQTVDDGRGQ